MLIRMKRLLSKYWKIGLTILFGLAVFLFWRFCYPFALAYQEQLQLFLFDDDYFLERMSEPGGFARYIAEFLMQFYNIVTIGAAIIALLFMLIQRLTWQLFYPRKIVGKLYVMSFIPVLMLWYAMGDENVMLTYVVSLVIALVLVLLWRIVPNLPSIVNWCLLLVILPLVYWLIGPMALLVALWIHPVWGFYVMGCMLLSAHYLPFPMIRVVLGVSYYRVPSTLPYVLIAIPVVYLLQGVALVFFRRFGHALSKVGKRGAVVCSVIVVVAAALLIPMNFDKKKYELIEYDYLVRVGDWNGIIAKAEKQMPDLPMSVSATNLALGMTNQLGERAFDFYQHGSEGLLPKFERNFATGQLKGEIYFNLGMVNTAQRFAFEAMEAIPNYNKSGRVMKRLAETNLINGQYEVARKYLRILEKTIFYRRWAQRTMAMLDDGQGGKSIDAHPLYGTLRKYRLQDDLLSSDRELDKICGQLFLHNQQNMMAAQYLLMMPLLDKDVPRFMQFVQAVQKRIPYNPRSCQEGIAFAFFQQRQNPPQGFINDYVLRRMNEFANVYGSDKNSPELDRFKNTVWYYLMVGQ